MGRTFHMTNHAALRVDCLGVLVLLFIGLSQSIGFGDEVISVLRDYSQQPAGDATAAIMQWNWSAEQKRDAKIFSQMQVIEHEGKRALSLRVTDQLPWGEQESYRVMQIGPDLLPPTADAVLLRCRVLEGSLTISIGGPTIYFGNSDVQSEPMTLAFSPKIGEREVVISLHDHLIRNFRRAGFAKQSPVIYYTRWIQEPLSLYVHRGSVGTILIEKVDLLNQGRGRAEAKFTADEIQLIAPIADFGNVDSLAAVFRATHEAIDFAGPAKLARANWKPPAVSFVAQGSEGHQGILQVEHQGAEEVVFTGLKVAGQAGANAIAVDMCVSNGLPLEMLSVDWVVYVSPVEKLLDFERLRPPEKWRSDAAQSFDFYMTQAAMKNESHAFFHARRALQNGKWSRVILPLADFVCVYGAGTMAEVMSQQKPVNPAQIVAIGWLPSFRQNKQVTKFQIDQMQWVHVPGDAATLRSFPQVDVSKVKLIPRSEARNGGSVEMVERE